MALLSDSDVRGLLDFLHEASEVDGPDAFIEPVVESLWRLIPCDGGGACIVVSGLDAEVQPEARTLLSFSEIDCEWCVGVDADRRWTPELDEVCRQYVERQDPIPP